MKHYLETLPAQETEVLTRDQEQPLIQASQQGNQQATQTLVNHNARWIIDEVYKRVDSLKADKHDLFQAAIEGLIDGIQRYNPDKGAKLITIAKHRIRDKLRDLSAETSEPTRLPLNIHDAHINIRRKQRELVQQLGREPSDQELREATRYPDREWQAYLELRELRYVSLNDSIGGIPTSGGYDNDSLIEGNEIAENLKIGSVWAPENNQPETELLKIDHLETIRQAILSLPEHEAKTIGLMYGLEDGNTYTKTELVGKLGLPERRIYEIIDSATAKLRHPGRIFQLIGV